MNETPDPHALGSALRRHARGEAPLAAAIALLFAHLVWLRNPHFVQHVRVLDRDPDGRPTYAVVHWDGVRDLLAARDAPASRSEWAVLAVVHSLADGDLSRAAGTCDATNAALVAGAVAAALGVRGLPPPVPAI